MFKEEIKEYCNSLNLDTVGFIKCRRFDELIEFYKDRKEMALENEFEEADIEKRINGFSKYTKGLDYHRVVKKYLDKICDFIKSKGGEAISFVDSNTLPERYIAYLANVGFIGRNNMIITEKYGSYVFLGEIITNLELANEEIRKFEQIKNIESVGNVLNVIKDVQQNLLI